MRKLAVAGIVWLGLVAGLLAVAIANRPEHKPLVNPGVPGGALRRAIESAATHSSTSLLDAWSSTYTLALILGTIALVVAATCILLVYSGDPLQRAVANRDSPSTE